MDHFKRLMSVLLVACTTLCLSASNTSAQGPVEDSPALRARADAIVGKMSLAEKLDYIGGTGFAVRAMPKLKLPSFEMSDGPYGVRSNIGFPSTTYAVGYIEGMQQHGVSATVKHFVGNNSEYLRHDSDSIIDQRTEREIYLPAFEAAVNGGVSVARTSVIS